LIAPAINGITRCVQLLVNARADLEAGAYDGQTALIAAAGAGSVPCTEFLLLVPPMLISTLEIMRAELH